MVVLAAAACLALSSAAVVAQGALLDCGAAESAIAALEEALDDAGVVRRFWLERRLRRVAADYAEQCVRLNEIQVVGTHNSYHQRPDPAWALILRLVGRATKAWDYSHRPLGEQLERLSLRQLELDVYADPEGGLYATPLGLRVVERDGGARLPELDAPGMKVLHVQDVDFQTSCATLAACLGEVKAWSDAHPRHLPVFILVEAKDEPILDAERSPFVVPIPFGAAELDDLDAEIRGVFPPERLLTPDDVRGDATTLEEAVLARGWPSLAASRGKVIFALDNGGDARALYRDGRPSLEGRVMFTDSRPGAPDAAFVKLNDPVVSSGAIEQLVRAGYLVRTRADADTVEARENDTYRRDTALASGAQYVSTDFPEAVRRFSDYLVSLPDGAPARCNPVNAPLGCRDVALELPRR